MTNLDSIKQTLVNISKGNDILDTLLEFERTLDNAEIFSYKNWILGELVEGPIISRYWFKTVWMFPMAMMPDPNAGLRLTKLGAKVNFRKSKFTKPVKVRGPQDWTDPQTKSAKLAEHDVWLVTIDMPLKFVNRGIDQTDEIIQKDIDETNRKLAGAFADDAAMEEPTDMQPLDSDVSPADTAGELDMTGQGGTI